MYMAYSLDMWYVASSSGPLQRLYKLCPLGRKQPHQGVINFTLSYIGKT